MAAPSTGQWRTGSLSALASCRANFWHGVHTGLPLLRLAVRSFPQLLQTLP
jgi:hypothetical protein